MTISREIDTFIYNNIIATNKQTILNFEDKEFIYFTLDLSNNQLTTSLTLSDITTSPIKKIRLFIFTNRTHFVTLNFTNRTKATYEIGQFLASSLRNLMKKFDTKYEYIFEHSTLNKIIKWDKDTVKDIYTEVTTNKPINFVYNCYAVIHQRILNNIVALMTDKLNQAEELPATIHIIDGGCGDGEFIVNFIAQIKPRLVPLCTRYNLDLEQILTRFKFIGFDFNEKNIENAQSKLLNHLFLTDQNCYFLLGNLFKIPEVIKQCVQENFIQLDNSWNFFVFSGSLTRKVLQNSFDTVKIFFKLLREIPRELINYIIIDGLNEPLLNNYMIKQFGLAVCSYPTSEVKRYLSICKPLSENELIKRKLTKLINTNILDLALSPDPCHIITTLDQQNQLHNHIVIDLSLAYINKNLLTELDKILIKFPRIKFIIRHHDKQANILFNHLFGRALIKHAQVIHPEREYFLLASNLFFTAMGKNNPTIPSNLTLPVLNTTDNLPTFVECLANLLTVKGINVRDCMIKSLLAKITPSEEVENQLNNIYHSNIKELWQQCCNDNRYIRQEYNYSELSGADLWAINNCNINDDDIINQIDVYLNNYLEKLITQIFSYEALELILIISKIYAEGLAFCFRDNTYIYGKNISKEINFYHILSEKFPSLFPCDTMQALAIFRANEELEYTKLSEQEHKFNNFNELINTLWPAPSSLKLT